VEFEQQLQTRAAQTPPLPPRPSRVGSVVILLVGTALMVLFAWWVYSWGDSSVPSNAPRGEERSYTSLTPQSFAKRLGDPGAFVVNVHIPYEGEIKGTDAFIAYDEISGDEDLPTDKGAEVLVYCRSGRMSKEASGALAADGYTNVYDLQGGMNAWESAGRRIVEKSDRS
jgi:rhodanese-related sulfurtransferase